LLRDQLRGRAGTIPAALATRLDRQAKLRGKSFSALIAELASDQREELPYAGIIEDDPDLSCRIDEVLSRLAD
jgi:hypothetical protein